MAKVNLSINQFFINFSCLWKCLKLYELNIMNQNKERLQKNASERYQNLSKEENERKQQ